MEKSGNIYCSKDIKNLFMLMEQRVLFCLPDVCVCTNTNTAVFLLSEIRTMNIHFKVGRGWLSLAKP